MPRSAGPKPLEWAPAARDAFDASIDFIANEDPFTARLVVQRVEILTKTPDPFSSQNWGTRAVFF
jgi:hypothetical protein